MIYWIHFYFPAYAKGFGLEDTLDEILTFVKNYDGVESCNRRSRRDPATKQHIFKGSCFITFNNLENCKKFIEAESIKYKETELIRKFQQDYFNGKKKEFEERKMSKMQKKDVQHTAQKEEMKKTLLKGVSLFFTGIEEGETLTREEIKEKINEISQLEPAFLDYSKNNAEGYIRMKTENEAKELFEKLTDGKLDIGDIHLEVKMLEGEEEEEYLKKTASTIVDKRQKNKLSARNNRKRKGNFNNDASRNKIKK